MGPPKGGASQMMRILGTAQKFQFTALGGVYCFASCRLTVARRAIAASRVDRMLVKGGAIANPSGVLGDNPVYLRRFRELPDAGPGFRGRALRDLP